MKVFVNGIIKHNEKCKDPYADSGFDLAIPEDRIV